LSEVRSVSEEERIRKKLESLKAEDKEFTKKLEALSSPEELREILYEFKIASGITISLIVQRYLRKRGEKP
jgi:hypothetical protein